jgi:hypothetical protein
MDGMVIPYLDEPDVKKVKFEMFQANTRYGRYGWFPRKSQVDGLPSLKS